VELPLPSPVTTRPQSLRLDDDHFCHVRRRHHLAIDLGKDKCVGLVRRKQRRTKKGVLGEGTSSTNPGQKAIRPPMELWPPLTALQAR
jgi:hypothetical protein